MGPRTFDSLGTGAETEGLPAELLGSDVPAERGVMGGAVDVAMEPLDRLRLENAPGAAGLEQPVHGLHAEPRDEGLVATVARAIQRRERISSGRPVEHLVDAVPMERAGRVHFGRGLRETQPRGPWNTWST